MSQRELTFDEVAGRVLRRIVAEHEYLNLIADGKGFDGISIQGYVNLTREEAETLATVLA